MNFATFDGSHRKVTFSSVFVERNTVFQSEVNSSTQTAAIDYRDALGTEAGGQKKQKSASNKPDDSSTHWLFYNLFHRQIGTAAAHAGTKVTVNVRGLRGARFGRGVSKAGEFCARSNEVIGDLGPYRLSELPRS
jgi:hypothetical protein